MQQQRWWDRFVWNRESQIALDRNRSAGASF
jgi:hypothetical protein